MYALCIHTWTLEKLLSAHIFTVVDDSPPHEWELLTIIITTEISCLLCFMLSSPPQVCDHCAPHHCPSHHHVHPPPQPLSGAAWGAEDAGTFSRALPKGRLPPSHSYQHMLPIPRDQTHTVWLWYVAISNNGHYMIVALYWELWYMY